MEPSVQIGLHPLVEGLVDGELVHGHEPGTHGSEGIEALVAAGIHDLLLLALAVDADEPLAVDAQGEGGDVVVAGEAVDVVAGLGCSCRPCR